MVTREEEPLKEQVKVKKKSLKEKIAYLKDNITLEPVLAGYVIPGVLSRLATQNLNLDKACRVNLKYGDAICDALIAKEGNMYQKEELYIQELIASMETWKNIILTALPSFIILFLGAWSDRTGKRKICILLPIVGDLLACLTITAGGPIGTALSGILLKYIGYYGIFTLSSMLYVCSICHGIFCIKDPQRHKQEKKTEEKPFSLWGFLKSFFDIKHVKDTLTVAFKNGPNHRRTKSILVLASIAFIYGPAHGEYTIRYLFTRYRFNWDAVKYSFYSTFYIGIHTLGALISISIFSRKLKWDDSMLGLISNVSKIVGALATGLARNGLEMYLAVAIEMFNATSFTALRSISSKLVTSDELGKMISFFQFNGGGNINDFRAHLFVDIHDDFKSRCRNCVLYKHWADSSTYFNFWVVFRATSKKYKRTKI
ncbi:unnamed protein product [Parnassius apollo]|uniref:(apollo) hypothetical protein n=1 Tax=Parnassius apollo TaxID=110799 RepID=A0A8S3YE14_PARAO|nr:unnamed protein product [Parnassius apollo]